MSTYLEIKTREKSKYFLIEIESQQAARGGPQPVFLSIEKAHRLSNQPAGHNERKKLSY
jgi:hypothetical protein